MLAGRGSAVEAELLETAAEGTAADAEQPCGGGVTDHAVKRRRAADQVVQVAEAEDAMKRWWIPFSVHTVAHA